MIALEKKKLAQKMENQNDSSMSDSDDSDDSVKVGNMGIQDENTINLSQMLVKDHASDFSNFTTGSLKVAELPTSMQRY